MNQVMLASSQPARGLSIGVVETGGRMSFEKHCEYKMLPRETSLKQG